MRYKKFMDELNIDEVDEEIARYSEYLHQLKQMRHMLAFAELDNKWEEHDGSNDNKNIDMSDRLLRRDQEDTVRRDGASEMVVCRAYDKSKKPKTIPEIYEILIQAGYKIHKNTIASYVDKLVSRGILVDCDPDKQRYKHYALLPNFFHVPS